MFNKLHIFIRILRQRIIYLCNISGGSARLSTGKQSQAGRQAGRQTGRQRLTVATAAPQHDRRYRSTASASPVDYTYNSRTLSPPSRLCSSTSLPGGMQDATHPPATRRTELQRDADGEAVEFQVNSLALCSSWYFLHSLFLCLNKQLQAASHRLCLHRRRVEKQVRKAHAVYRNFARPTTE